MTPPQDSRLTLSEALRVACQGGRAEAELIAPAIETLAREYRRLEPEAALPDVFGRVVSEGENAGILDALLTLDFLYVAVRRASDKAHAAAVAAVLP